MHCASQCTQSEAYSTPAGMGQDSYHTLSCCSSLEGLILKKPLTATYPSVCLSPDGYSPSLWLSEPCVYFSLTSLELRTIWGRGSGKHSSQCFLCGADDHLQVVTITKLVPVLLSFIYGSTWPLTLWAVAGTPGGTLQIPVRLTRSQYHRFSSECQLVSSTSNLSLQKSSSFLPT